MTRDISLIILLAATLGLASAGAAAAACGDGTLDPGEQCDLGSGNGNPTTDTYTTPTIVWRLEG